MASGDTLVAFIATDNHPPAAGYATPDVRNSHPVLDFDADADESAIFSAVMPRHYSGGGVTVTLHTAASSATSGSSRWQTAFERLNASGQDLDADGFATANSGAAVADAVNGETTATAIAHTNGAEIDSIAVGEPFRLRVTRDADGTSGTDDMTGDAELLAVEIRET